MLCYAIVSRRYFLLFILFIILFLFLYDMCYPQINLNEGDEDTR